MKRLYRCLIQLLFSFTVIAMATTAMATTTAPAANAQSKVATPTAAMIQAKLNITAPKAEIPIATPNPPVPGVPTASIGSMPSIIPTAPQLNATGYVLIDEKTGTIIAHKNMHKRMQPASLTKLMTLYLTFEALKDGQIHLTDKVRISKKAWATGGSRMFVNEGSLVPVQKLLDGIVVASGNDACTALAQYVGGNLSTFVEMMNATAQQLSMKGTQYKDVTGLPKPGHYTTPYDMAILTRAIIANFPQYYHIFNQKWITYNGIKQPNTNQLLWRDPTVDGLKTGHTKAAGYCLISSALRKGTRLVSVVMGAPTHNASANDSEALLNWGYRFYRTYKLFDANQSLATPTVYLGSSNKTPIGLAKPLYITAQIGSFNQLKSHVSLKKLKAPIKKGQVVGTLHITLNKKIVASAPLIALENDPKGGFLTRSWDHITDLF